MRYIEEDNFMIFPLDYISFIELSYDYGQNLKYTKSYNFTEKMAHEINTYIKDNRDKYIALDMSNIGGIPQKLNYYLDISGTNIVIFNIKNDVIKTKISHDFQGNIEWLDAYTACSSDALDSLREMKYRDTFDNCRKKEQNRIVRSLAERLSEPQRLDSTGLFCNYYIDFKKLFSNPHDFHYIIYNLAGLMYGKLENIDAIITSSRNGAILASVLGGLLRIKEVHLIGIGPKYAARLGDSVDCIREGKRYAYIFDFMCTGTEMKITNALINSKKAYFENAFGIATLYKKNDIGGVFEKKIHSLTDVEEAGIDYKVSASYKDIEKYIAESVRTK